MFARAYPSFQSFDSALLWILLLFLPLLAHAEISHSASAAVAAHGWAVLQPNIGNIVEAASESK